MLGRAQKAERVFPALEQITILKTRSVAPSGATEYGNSPTTRSMLGRDLTEPVASYLRGLNLTESYIWTLSPTQLDQLGVDNDHVEIRRVGVGGFIIGNLFAGDRCSYDGRARGVARKTSTGSKG
jgi:hypothetical protein